MKLRRTAAFLFATCIALQGFASGEENLANDNQEILSDTAQGVGTNEDPAATALAADAGGLGIQERIIEEIVDETKEIDGDINVLKVDARNEDAGAVVNGDVSLENNLYTDVVWVNVHSEDLKAEVEIDGDVKGTVMDGNTSGILTPYNEGGTIDIQISGDVSVEQKGTIAPGTENNSPYDGVAEYAQAINIISQGDKASTTVTVGGGVESTADRGPSQGIVAAVTGDHSEIIIRTGTESGGGVTVAANAACAPNSSMPGRPGEARGVEADITANEGKLNVTVSGDVSATGEVAKGIGETIIGDHNNGTVQIEGSVYASGSKGEAEGVSVYADGKESTGNVTVEGNVTAVSEDTDATGIQASAKGEGKAVVNIQGDVHADSKNQEDGAKDDSQADPKEENGEVKEDSDADDSTERNGTKAIVASAQNGTVDIAVDGTVISNGIGIDASASSQEIQREEEYQGDVSGMKELNQEETPIFVPRVPDGTIQTTNYIDPKDMFKYFYREIIVDSEGNTLSNRVYTNGEYTGDLTGFKQGETWTTDEEDGQTVRTSYTDQEGREYTQVVEKDKNGNIVSSKVIGDIVYYGSMDGLEQSGEPVTRTRWTGGYEDGKTVTRYYQDDQGTSYRTVTSYNADGLQVGNEKKYIIKEEQIGTGNVTVKVGNGIAVKGEGDLSGVQMKADDSSKLEIQVLNGGITVTGTDGNASAVGAYLENNASEITLTVKGGITTDGNAKKSTALVVNANGDSQTNVKVEGDVTSDGTGLEIGLSDSESKASIVVDGTISGEKHNILLSEEKAENLSITVWQVKSEDENAPLIEKIKTDKEGNTTYTQDREAEQRIQYIIRIAQPDLISTTGTVKSEGFDVAKEGEEVYLKLNIPTGYEVAEAWQDEGQKTKLLKDYKGEYYLAVPKGGGVLLSVTLKEIAAEPEKEPVSDDSNKQESKGVEEKPETEPAQPLAPETNDMTVPQGKASVPEGNIAGQDADAAELISKLLLKNGIRIPTNVSIVTDRDGLTTLEIAQAEHAEASEENTELKMAIPAELMETLSLQNVKKLKMYSYDRHAAVELDISEALTALRGRNNKRLILEIVSNPVIGENVRSFLNEGNEIIDGAAISARILIQEEDGTQTELEAGSACITMMNEYREDMRILYIKADKKAAENAVRIDNAKYETDHWRIPYMGSGIYLQAVEK